MDTYEIILRLRAGIACGRESTCSTKKCYGSETLAHAIARSLSQKTGKKLEAYPCVFCGNWHIGNKIDIDKLEELANQLDDMI